LLLKFCINKSRVVGDKDSNDLSEVGEVSVKFLDLLLMSLGDLDKEVMFVRKVKDLFFDRLDLEPVIKAEESAKDTGGKGSCSQDLAFRAVFRKVGGDGSASAGNRGRFDGCLKNIRIGEKIGVRIVRAINLGLISLN